MGKGSKQDYFERKVKGSQVRGYHTMHALLLSSQSMPSVQAYTWHIILSFLRSGRLPSSLNFDAMDDDETVAEGHEDLEAQP